MRAASLFRLYPRAWRHRYAEEVRDAFGDRTLTPRLAVDIVRGAIDAWLSADVRRAVSRERPRLERGPSMVSTIVCERPRPTTRDALIGAAVMIGGSFLLTGAGLVAEGRGWPAVAEALTSVSFPIAMMLSMPFWLMKGQRRKAQAVIVVGTTACLVGVSVLAALW